MPFTKDAWGSSQYERNLQMGFNIGGPSLIDIRLVLTKEQMKTVDRHVMPPKYFALCADNNQLYYYDKSLNRGPVEKEDGRIIGNFTRVNIQISGIQDQYGNSLIDGDVAKIFVARKLSELINDKDSDGDGLSDYLEVMVMNYNPNRFDYHRNNYNSCVREKKRIFIAKEVLNIKNVYLSNLT